MDFITYVLASHGDVGLGRSVIQGSVENSDATVNRKKRPKLKSELPAE